MESTSTNVSKTEERTAVLETVVTKKRVVQPDTCVAGESRDALHETGSEEPFTYEKVNQLRSEFLSFVSDIQTAADASESSRRSKFEEASRKRLQRLDEDVRASQVKYEAITEGWTLAAQKTFHLDIQAALTSQQQLCTALMEDKWRLINDLKEELKSEDDRFVKDLRKQSEELELMLEKIRAQFEALTEAYREELDQAEKTYQEEHEILLREDQTQWQQHLEGLLEQQQKRAKEKRELVEECEEKLHLQMLTTDQYSKTEHRRQYLDLEREHQQMQADRMIADVRQIKIKDDTEIQNVTQEKNKIMSLTQERKRLQRECADKETQLLRNRRVLAEEYERRLLEQESLNKKIRLFASSHAKTYSEMNQMLQAETDLLAEKLSFIDSVISQHPLGPSLVTPLAEAPLEAPQDAPVVTAPLATPRPDFRFHTGRKEEELVMKLKDLLREEPLDLHVDDDDLLADFLSEYTQQMKGADSPASLTCDLFDPDHVLPALTSFLKTRRSLSSSSSDDDDDDEDYWKRMSNMVSEDKLKLWAAAEETVKLHYGELKEISDLISETESLKQQNAELRLLLEQPLLPAVDNGRHDS
ncbi:dynein regulatory complex protein 1 isoform 1-T2 [Synchiropus picturatus]